MSEVGIVAAIGAALVIGSVALVVIENSQWDSFSQEHHCKVVGKTTADVGFGTGIGANGQITSLTTVTPGKTGYLCDDGVTYWR